MNFIEFRNHFKDRPVFSLHEARLFYPDFYLNRLTDWQRKGYIRRVIKNHYVFTDSKLDKETMFFIANRIYQPSYISLESAFSYYRLIPEGVFTFTSVSSRKTTILRSEIGTFFYRKIRPDLIWGYDVIRSADNIPFKLAKTEKALLDYFYLNAHLKSADDFFELRFDEEELGRLIQRDIFNEYLAAFNNKQLEKRANTFLRYIYAQP